ncbi:MAG: DUF3043 domain-containing protein [Dermatophilaceae bacterium]
MGKATFGRKKQEAEASAPAPKEHEHREGAKNRPTPKRKDQEAARKRPLVQTDRKAAKRQAREERRKAAAIQHRAMLTGDESHLPARDRGPVRRYIRDFVDARWNIGEWLLPIMLITLIVSYLRPSQTTLAITMMLYLLVLFAIGDALLTWRKIKGRLSTKYSAAELRGGGFYTFMRSFQLRRWRMPRAQVARGQFPAL